MTEATGYLLGFDPGGKGGDKEPGNFGWCICRSIAGQFRLIDTGRVKYAEEAVRQVSNKLLPNFPVWAVGIDAPMFWNITGEERKVDCVVKQEVKKALEIQKQRGQECENPPSLMQVNSLPGAVLVQGVLVGAFLHQRFKSPITEAYPGALRCLLRAGSKDNSLPIELRRYEDKLKRSKNPRENHEWDALAAAYAAWCMHRQVEGWRDLFPREPNPILPLGTPVSYWMPIP